ncbi:hypothetical protein RJ640_007757 [Escallonia rubra]|uniref:F-box domain-containing protein n=1 Tax=Escallonia rubra TaxID=112253 RepID=A0AA88QTE9_9ASTE|nr:hypothetical protein RJ640_007757 [Escallonia rubra]
MVSLRSKRSCRRETCLPGDRICSNEDLLRQILIHVPQKPLLRFKTVSKPWLSVITEPNFSLQWNSQHPLPSASGLFLRRYSSPAGTMRRLAVETPIKYFFVPLDQREKDNPSSPPFECAVPLVDRYPIKIIQSCNGLFLCSETQLDFDFGGCNYYVFNPTTKQCATLPSPRGTDEHNTVEAMILAFEPRRSLHYKVVSLSSLACNPNALSNYQIKIFSSATRTWTTLWEVTFSTWDEVSFEMGVFFNGLVYWPSRWLTDILYFFDVDDECTGEMPMLPVQGSRGSSRTIRYFGESQGRLYLISDDDYTTPLEFEVYEMENQNSGWFLKYHVDLSVVRVRNINKFMILSLVRGEIKEDSSLVMYLPEPSTILDQDDMDLIAMHTRPRLIDTCNVQQNHQLISGLSRLDCETKAY